MATLLARVTWLTDIGDGIKEFHEQNVLMKVPEDTYRGEEMEAFRETIRKKYADKESALVNVLCIYRGAFSDGAARTGADWLEHVRRNEQLALDNYDRIDCHLNDRIYREVV